MPEKLTIPQLRKKRITNTDKSMSGDVERSTVSGKSYLREFGNSKYHVNELRKLLDPDNAEWEDNDERRYYDNDLTRPGKFSDVAERLKMFRAKRFKEEFKAYPRPEFLLEYTDRLQKLSDLRKYNEYLIERGKLDKDTNDYSELERYERASRNFDRVRNNALKQRYLKDIEQLKIELAKRMNITRTQRESAQRCLDLIRKYDNKVLRFENLGIALSNLGQEKPFAGKESFVSDRFPLSNPETLSPIATRGVASFNADRLTGGFGDYKYTSVVFFQQAAFDPEHQHGHDNWGTIRNLGINTMLGIQVLHWDPKVVYQTAKAMLKIRPKDPVVIFDLYGNIFFP